MRKAISLSILTGLVVIAVGLPTAVVPAVGDTAFIRAKVGNLHERLKAIGLGEVQPDPADTTLEGGNWFFDFLSSVSQNWGAVTAVDSPTFVSDHEASIVIRLERNAYEIVLEINQDGEWGDIKLSNYVAEKDRTKLDWADLGDDTLRVTDLPELSLLVNAFNADSGKVRLVSILSPT